MSEFNPVGLLGGALVAAAGLCWQAAPVIAQDEQSEKPTAITEQYGAWTLVCQSGPENDESAGESSETCGLRTSIVVQDRTGARRPLAAAFIAPAAEAETEAHAIVFQVPAGVFLRAPVTLRDSEADLEADPPVSATYVNCTPSACVADAVVPAAAMTALQEAKSLQLSFVGADGRRISVPFPREGLTQALRALSSRR